MTVERRCANLNENAFCRLKLFGVCVSSEYLRTQKQKLDACKQDAFSSLGENVYLPKPNDGKAFICLCKTSKCLPEDLIKETESGTNQGGGSKIDNGSGTNNNNNSNGTMLFFHIIVWTVAKFIHSLQTLM